MPNLASTGWRWLWIAVLIVLLDRLTKYLAVHFLVPFEPLRIFSLLNLTLGYNKGAAFGFLNNASHWQTWLFGTLAVLVSIALLIWLKNLSSKQRWMSIALTLIVGGALGNLCDRILYGYVTDFIEFHFSHWSFPAFNVADSAICVGAFMVLFDALFLQKKQNR